MKKLFSLCLALCVVLSSFVVVHADGLQGAGTAENPYLISTPQELQEAAKLVNAENAAVTDKKDATAGKYYKLTADLDFTNFDYGEDQGFVPFTYFYNATFDGDFHTISNVKISTEATDSSLIGLFGEVSNSTFKNLGIIDAKVEVKSNKMIGILAGRVKDNTTFEDCFIRRWNLTYTLNSEGKKQDCTFAGFVGQIFWGQPVFKNCYVINNAESDTWYMGTHGDFFGGASSNTNASFTAINCYSTGGEFASKCTAVSPFTIKVVNCYKNKSGIFKDWHNSCGGSGTYLGTSITPEELKANDRLMGIYVEDTEGVNDGFPRLRWETERGAAVGASEANPYLIRSYKDFDNFRTYVNNGYGENEYFKMTTDLDIGANVSNNLLESYIGQKEAAPFKGFFDGDGHVFKNFNIELYSGFDGSFGVFGKLNGNAVVKNTGVENVTFIKKHQCYQRNGGLIGLVLGNALVENCYARNVGWKLKEGAEDLEHMVLGGLIGAVSSANATVRNCYAAKCDVAANVNRDAELIGYVSEQATITNCYSDSRLLKADNNVDRSKFTQCYATKLGKQEDGKDWSGDDSTYFMPNTTTDELKTLTESLGGAFVPGTAVNDGYPQLAWERGFDVITSAQKSGNQITVTINKGNADQGTLFAAAYNGDTMVRAAIGTEKVTASGTYTVDLSVGDGETAKVFLILDDGSQFTPLSMRATVN